MAVLELLVLPLYNDGMSAEFTAEHNENTIVTAVENMERAMRTFGLVGEYVQNIQETYGEYPEGKVELMRMIRAAQLIANRGAADTGEEVQAIYHGELLGLELVNTLEPDIGQLFKTGYAQSFIAFHLNKDRPAHTEAAESNLEHQARLIRLSQSIQTDLSCPMYAHGLHPIYEEFGQKATSKLNDDTQYQDSAMMGFRMIVTEALKPSMNGNASEIMEKFQVPVKEPKVTPRTIANLEKNYAWSIYKTDEIIGEQEDINFVDWQDISHIREIFYDQFSKLNFQEEAPQLPDTATIAEAHRHIEAKLTQFAQDNELITVNDLLSIYDKNTEIRGNFDSIKIVEVHPNGQLSDVIYENVEGEESDLGSPVASLAIRITNPVFIIESIDGQRVIGHAEDETFDIPLTYENTTYRSIKAEELEPEA